jgi:hypothetical protein
MTGHEIGLLKEYMQDLVEQAQQETMTLHIAGYQQRDYSSEEALMDLLAILDDRFESEGAQVGLTEAFCHHMWNVCRNSRDYVKDTAWLEVNLNQPQPTKEQIRKITYKALLRYIQDEAA